MDIRGNGFQEVDARNLLVILLGIQCLSVMYSCKLSY